MVQRKKMISKELLSKVLNVKVDFIIDTKNSNKENLVVYQNGNFWEKINTYQINIHELAHKCKEWAKTYGYYITSGYADTDYDRDSEQEHQDYLMLAIINLRCGYYSYNSKHDKDYWKLDSEFYAETEEEAIFTACEWVLEQQNKEGILQ